MAEFFTFFLLILAYFWGRHASLPPPLSPQPHDRVAHNRGFKIWMILVGAVMLLLGSWIGPTSSTFALVTASMLYITGLYQNIKESFN